MCTTHTGVEGNYRERIIYPNFKMAITTNCINNGLITSMAKHLLLKTCIKSRYVYVRNNYCIICRRAKQIAICREGVFTCLPLKIKYEITFLSGSLVN